MNLFFYITPTHPRHFQLGVYPRYTELMTAVQILLSILGQYMCCNEWGTVLHIMLPILGQYTCSPLGANTFYSFNHKDGQLIEFNLRAKSKSWYFKVTELCWASSTGLSWVLK